ncbi:transglutaminase-like cysteine peptidase [Rhizorhapis sp. SPR117]|uniref:transglutaminase-like cysteine peptidase n=1 Tax=Rhizorhapis sp. SPR117 TaxID=2912611 RepID=UPI001F18B3D0|nr:transglutaminase-like cysteine peptidase [Rhizorhapis sp. SPR117]
MARSFVVSVMLLALSTPVAAQDVAPPDDRCAQTDIESPLGEGGLSITLPAEDEEAVACTPTPVAVRPPGPDIFGSVALAVAATSLDARWRNVMAEPIEAEAGPWRGLIRQAAAQNSFLRLQLVNNWVNTHVAFVEDRADDHWANLTETIARGQGDCEDYAIAKMQLLESAGVPSDTLYLVIVTDVARHADHAVLAVREGTEMFILDNNTDRVLRSRDVVDYRPIVSFSTQFSWTHGYRTAGQGQLQGIRMVSPDAASY